MNEQPASNPETSPPPLPPTGRPVPFAPGLFGTMEGILKNPAVLLQSFLRNERAGTGLHLLIIVTGCMAAFGLVLATFSGGSQWLWAPLKVSGGLLLSGLLCLPSLYVFGCLSGVSIRPGAAASVLLAMLGLCGLVVLGFAPVAWIFAQSTNSVVFVGFLVLVMWIIALWFGFGVVRQAMRLLGAGAMEHIRIWLAIFAIVTLQMSTTLRPILGSSDRVFPAERKFFFEHWWETLTTPVVAHADAAATPPAR